MEEKLYELLEGKEELERLTETEEIENKDEFFKSINLQIEKKTENIIKFYKNRESFVDRIDEEIKRLQSLKKSFVRGNENLENYLKYTMESKGILKLESPLGNISFRKSKSVEIVDEKLLNDDCFETKKVVSKTKIKQLLDEGKEVLGARIITNNNLIIK